MKTVDAFYATFYTPIDLDVFDHVSQVAATWPESSLTLQGEATIAGARRIVKVPAEHIFDLLRIVAVEEPDRRNAVAQHAAFIGMRCVTETDAARREQFGPQDYASQMMGYAELLGVFGVAEHMKETNVAAARLACIYVRGAMSAILNSSATAA